MSDSNADNDDGLILDAEQLAADPVKSNNSQCFPLSGVFMVASARYREPHSGVDDPSNEPNATVSVNLKGTLDQTNVILPYMNERWFTYPKRDYVLKAVGIAASHHGYTSVTGYYWDDYSDTAFTLQRRVRDNQHFDGALSDWSLNDWAKNRVPDGVVWVDDDVTVLTPVENEQQS